MTDTVSAPDLIEPVEGGVGAPAADRLKPSVKWAYGMGGTTDIFGHWLYLTLADPVFNAYFHLTPTEIGWVKAVALAVDACAGLLFGWLSDNTRTRWGRRRPYILVGSILSGLGLPFLFLPSQDWGHDKIFWFMMISAACYAPVIAAYNSPYQSLGSELTPDVHERTSVMGYKAVVQKSSGMLLGTALPFAQLAMFGGNVARGAMASAAIAGAIMVVVGFINFRYVPERYYATVQTKQEKVGFVEMIHKTFSCFPFVVLLGVAFTYAIPTSAMNTLGYYAGNYYVTGGDLELYGRLAMWGGFAYAIFGMGGIQPARILSVRYGKRMALSIILMLGMITFGLSWVLFDPANPWLMVIHSGLNGFCATGLWVILPSMTVDTVDYEEGRSGQRREGGFNSAFSWTMKAGMVAASVLAGTALDGLTGFRAELGGDQTPETMQAIRLIFALGPMAACALSLGCLALYPLTTERMNRLRQELEQRRGHV